MVFEKMRTRLVQQGEFSLKLFGATLLLRTVDLFLIQSFFVPDEYWQSLEVAHGEVFGYGYRTWEWKEGIRSYIYVSLVSALYYVLKLLQIDTRWTVVWAPRVFQGVLSALSDVYFVRWVHEKRYRQHSWAFITWVTSYFVSYCSTRTLINTVEMNLTTIALYYYPWSPKRNNAVFVALVSFLFFLRPTSAVTWVPLVVANVVSVPNRVKYVFTSYVPVGLGVGSLCFLVDSYFYGRWVLTPWEFFSFNVLRNVGVQYGTHPLLWYFYLGIPVVLGVQTVPFFYKMGHIAYSFVKSKRKLKYDAEYQVAATVLWSVVILSLVPHKEFRFLLPLMPMMLFISSSVWSKWSVRAELSHIYAVAFVLIVSNFCAVLFLGQFHQTGRLDAVKHLSEDVKNASESKLLFLTPCHSLPLYSHLHVDVKSRFVTCEPNLRDVDPFADESEEFFANPQLWLRKEYVGKNHCDLPTHVVAYDGLNITNFLHLNQYNLSASFFDSYFYPERAGEYINVYKRKGKLCPT